MTKLESIVLGGGCFWCLDAAYRQLEGVSTVVSGYSGGSEPHPTYDDVAYGGSGHVEVVRVEFDPDIIDLNTILAVFWSLHDPTSLNRQGADAGPQYASVIFYDGQSQQKIVKMSQDEAQSQLDAKIVTRIEQLGEFYPAEDYHQDYFAKNQNAGYCSVVIEPKLAKLREHFTPLLRR